jgi:hypothetical protein
MIECRHQGRMQEIQSHGWSTVPLSQVKLPRNFNPAERIAGTG